MPKAKMASALMRMNKCCFTVCLLRSVSEELFIRCLHFRSRWPCQKPERERGKFRPMRVDNHSGPPYGRASDILLPLNQQRNSHSAANAKGRQATLCASFLHFVQKRG